MGHLLRVLVVCVVMAGCGEVVKDKASCGDGTVTSGEECDQGADNGTSASCCTAACKLVSAGMTCRDATGECDVAETCNGTDATCPADMHVADGMSCTANGVSACSAADTCQAGACAPNDSATGTPCGAGSGSGACNLDTCGATGVCGAKAMQNIAIIESQSVSGSAQNMDTIWQTIATGLGHTATILPQTALDDPAMLASYDILIVSGFDIPISPARRTNIRGFVEAKKGAYVQGEYLASYEGNAVFMDVANQLGAGFTWGADVTGNIDLQAPGCFGTSPFVVTGLTQGYGVTGSATATAGFHPLEVQGAQGFGFMYCRTGGGELMVTTDKDNIRSQTPGVPELMKNILYQLQHADTCQ